jgi:hypothetical protein
MRRESGCSCSPLLIAADAQLLCMQLHHMHVTQKPVADLQLLRHVTVFPVGNKRACSTVKTTWHATRWVCRLIVMFLCVLCIRGLAILYDAALEHVVGWHAAFCMESLEAWIAGCHMTNLICMQPVCWPNNLVTKYLRCRSDVAAVTSGQWLQNVFGGLVRLHDSSPMW